jgi:hypothetical protein
VIHNRRSLSLAACILTAACSEGRNETPDAGSTGREPGSAPAAATAHAPSVTRGTVPMKIVAEVHGKTYRSSGTGECASSTDASIYEVPATLWHAVYKGDASDPRRLNLTVWRPQAGGDMVSLSLEIGETTHRIATVKGAPLAGSGVPGVQSTGAGGTLTAAGRDDHGGAIALSVECERFDEVVAEGG